MYRWLELSKVYNTLYGKENITIPTNKVEPCMLCSMYHLHDYENMISDGQNFHHNARAFTYLATQSTSMYVTSFRHPLRVLFGNSIIGQKEPQWECFNEYSTTHELMSVNTKSGRPFRSKFLR